MIHDYNHGQSHKFIGFDGVNSKFPFMGVIDITLDYAFTGSMDPPPTYHIVEVHDAHMIGITTRIGHVMDRPSSPP